MKKKRGNKVVITETILDYLQKLQLRLPEKIKKKRELKRINEAVNLTRDAIIVDAIIEPKPN